MKIRKVKVGWAAMGDGWAVFGATETEAAEKYRNAVILHAEIMARDDPVLT